MLTSFASTLENEQQSVLSDVKSARSEQQMRIGNAVQLRTAFSFIFVN
jgi:hypothetical protein